MAWTVPPMPDELKAQLMRRQNPMAQTAPVPPATGATPMVPYGPQPTPETLAVNRAIEGGQPARTDVRPPPGVPIFTRPSPSVQTGMQGSNAQDGAQLQAGQPSQPPTPPSDDPSISPVQPPPDVSSYLNPALSRMNDLMAKRAAVPAVDPNQVKPRWWERALAVALGATQLRNPENAANVADMVVHRRLYGAERARNLALQPIDEQIKSEREAFPLYTAAGEAAYRQAELGSRANTENRERYTARTNNEYKTKWNDIREQRNNETAAENEAKNKQQEGVLAERERHDQETEGLRGQLNDVRDRLATVQENKPGPGEKRGTPGQFAGAEVKKNQAIQKAHAAFVKATSDLDPNDRKDTTRRAFQEAHDDYEEATQDAQNAYEQELTSLGGVAQHSDTSQWRGNSKAQPSPGTQAGAEKVNELGGRKVGDVGVVRGQRVRITNIYKNGKFDYEPVTAQ